MNHQSNHSFTRPFRSLHATIKGAPLLSSSQNFFHSIGQQHLYRSSHRTWRSHLIHPSCLVPLLSSRLSAGSSPCRRCHTWILKWAVPTFLPFYFHKQFYMNGVLLLFVVCLACPFVMDAYRDKKTNNTRSKSSDQPQTNGKCPWSYPSTYFILFYFILFRIVRPLAAFWV